MGADYNLLIDADLVRVCKDGAGEWRVAEWRVATMQDVKLPETILVITNKMVPTEKAQKAMFLEEKRKADAELAALVQEALRVEKLARKAKKAAQRKPKKHTKAKKATTKKLAKRIHRMSMHKKHA